MRRSSGLSDRNINSRASVADQELFLGGINVFKCVHLEPDTEVNIFYVFSDLVFHQCYDEIIIFIFPKKIVKLRKVKERICDHRVAMGTAVF